MQKEKNHPKIGDNEFYQALYDNHLCGIVEYLGNGEKLRITGANKIAQQIYGIDLAEDYFDIHEEYIGFSMEEEYRKEFIARIDSLKKPGDFIFFESICRKTDDSTVWVEGEAILTSDVDGQRNIVCLLVDINRRKNYEESLKRERDKYNAMVQTVPCAIVQFDYVEGNRRILDYNDATWQIMNFKSREAYAEVAKQGGSAKVYEEDVPYTQMLFERAIKGDRPASFSHRLVCADGEEKWVSGKSESCMTPDGHKYYRSVFMDDTARQEEELKKEKNYRKEIFDMSNAPEDLLSRIRFNVTTNKMERYKAQPEIAVPGAETMKYDEFLKILLGQIIDEEERTTIGRLLGRRGLKEDFAKGQNDLYFVFRRKRKDKKFVWFHMRVKLVQEPNTKNLIGFAYSGAENDMKDYLTTSSMLMGRFHAITDKKYYFVIELDYDRMRYDIIRYNHPEQEVNKISGSMEELLQNLHERACIEQIPGLESIRNKEMMKEQFAEGKEEFVFEMQDKNIHEKWIEGRIIPVKNPEERDLYLFTMADISERKKKEEESRGTQTDTSKRLEAFEKTYQALIENLNDVSEKMEEQKKAGRTNSATFRQLLGKKVNLENMLQMFKIYGIED